jgi:hypothetical protein
MRKDRLNSTPIIALVPAAACWGAATVITKHALTNIPPLPFSCCNAKSARSSLWAIQCCTYASAWRHA